MSGAEVILFVEDPGAANYAAELPALLGARGRRVALLADGHAREYLRHRGVAWEPWPAGTAADDFLAARRPRLVVVGTAENPDTPGLALVAAARRQGIASAGMVDAAANAAHRFRGPGASPLAHAPDWLFVPDDHTRAAFVELGYPGGRIICCGHPHYDFVAAAGERLALVGREALRRRLFPQAEPGRRLVVFAAEISAGLDAGQYRLSADYTLRGDGSSVLRTDIVLEEFLAAVRTLPGEPPYLVLRLHPKNRPDEFAAFAGRFDAVSTGGNSQELVCAAALVVGMTTMLLLEAAILGRPVLSILPRRAEAAWLPAIGLGLVPCVWERAALPGALAGALDGRLRGPRAGDVLQFGASERCAAAIDRLLDAAAGIPLAWEGPTRDRMHA